MPLTALASDMHSSEGAAQNERRALPGLVLDPRSSEINVPDSTESAVSNLVSGTLWHAARSISSVYYKSDLVRSASRFMQTAPESTY
jgi:hypothetical protein